MEAALVVFGLSGYPTLTLMLSAWYENVNKGTEIVV